MNSFTQSSILERQKMMNLFEKFNVTNYAFTDEEGYDQHDGTYVTSKGINILYEVKVRKVKSTDYSTTVIEKTKYDYLLNKAYETNSEPHIFIFFSDGKYLVQNLEKAEVTFTKKKAPRTTAGNNEMIDKHFAEIKIKQTNTYNQ